MQSDRGYLSASDYPLLIVSFEILLFGSCSLIELAYISVLRLRMSRVHCIRSRLANSVILAMEGSYQGSILDWSGHLFGNDRNGTLKLNC